MAARTPRQTERNARDYHPNSKGISRDSEVGKIGQGASDNEQEAPRQSPRISAQPVLQDKMKKQHAIVTSIVLTLLCGCSDKPNHEELASESSVVVLCRNRVKDGMIIGEISEVWRDESNGAFTEKVGDIIETYVPTDSPTSCGEASVMFFGRLKDGMRNHRTLYVHDGKVDRNVPVEKLRSLIQATHFSGRELELPSRPSGDTERR